MTLRPAQEVTGVSEGQSCGAPARRRLRGLGGEGRWEKACVSAPSSIDLLV